MSDIFNSYAKIMAEKGLVKESQRSDEAKTRPQGIDPEAIQMLYHVKPNGTDEKPIVEQAHPEPVVVAPSYDRFNGLVENVQERQNMMLEIMEDPQHGKLTHHRYVKANQELLQEVIKAGFLMDRKNQEDLMKLADSCAEELANPLKKNSTLKKIAWVGIALKVGAALLTAAGLVNNFGGKIDRGVVLNANRAIEELSELTDNLPQYGSVINKLIDDIQTLRDLNQSLSDTGVSIFGDENKVELEIEKQKTKLVEYITLSRQFSARVRKFITVLDNTKADTYEQWVTENLGDPGEVLTSLWRGFVGTDAGDVINILETLDKSLQESVKNIRNIFRVSKKKAEQAVDLKDEEAMRFLFPQDQVKEDLPEADLDQFLGQLQNPEEATADDESY